MKPGIFFKIFYNLSICVYFLIKKKKLWNDHMFFVCIMMWFGMSLILMGESVGMKKIED